MTRRRWSQRRIIQAIQSRHKRGLKLSGIWNDDLALGQAAFRHFGSWRKAVAAAGFEPRQTWSRKRIIETLRGLQSRQSRVLRNTDARQHNAALVSAVHRYFGNWRDAMSAADLAVPELPKALTVEEVVEAFQSRHRQGLPTTRFWREDPELRAAVRRHFGSWSNAMKASGIPFKPPRRWTKSAVVEEIQAIDGKNPDEALKTAGLRYFGSWHDALVAAGISSPDSRPKTRKRRTKKQVIAEIRTRHQQGQSIRSKDDKALAHAARKYFDRWQDALFAAGVPFASNYKHWSKELVLFELQMLDQQGAFEESTQVGDRRLKVAARRYFGTWRRALIAAGILEQHEMKRWRLRWSKQRVVEVIQDRHIRGLSVSSDSRLVAAACRYFGSFQEARIAAGIRRKTV